MHVPELNCCRTLLTLGSFFDLSFNKVRFITMSAFGFLFFCLFPTLLIYSFLIPHKIFLLKFCVPHILFRVAMERTWAIYNCQNLSKEMLYLAVKSRTKKIVKQQIYSQQKQNYQTKKNIANKKFYVHIVQVLSNKKLSPLFLWS